MADFKPVGAALLYLGDFATPSVTQIVDVETVEVDYGVSGAYTSNASLNGTPTASGQFRLAPKPVVRAQIADAGIDQLALFLPGITKATSGSDEAIGFGSSFTAIAEASVPSLFVLPDQQSADGVDAANGIWLPAVTITGPNGMSFGRVPEGEILQPFNVEFRGAYRDTDQGSTAIPENARIIFVGPPAAFSLTWALS